MEEADKRDFPTLTDHPLGNGCTSGGPAPRRRRDDQSEASRVVAYIYMLNAIFVAVSSPKAVPGPCFSLRALLRRCNPVNQAAYMLEIIGFVQVDRMP